VSSYHQVSAKHLDAYLDELEFRFNNRENPHMFRDEMLKLVVPENLPYRKADCRFFVGFTVARTRDRVDDSQEVVRPVGFGETPSARILGNSTIQSLLGS
jgi:hypothetical protein